MFLEIQHIDKSFGKDQIVKDLNFTLAHHQTLSILGKSGCGKTSMLKIIAGLLKEDRGKILLHGEDISHWPPEKRSIVYLYQEDLLFPHLNVFENIAFGLRIKKMKSTQIQEQVTEMLSFLELENHRKKMPHELSGGQRQRVSFGRAIITNPSLLLLDEPFGSLDASTRQKMQKLFKDISNRYKISSLFVTHDLKEALLMGDKIAYMQKGNLKLYESPQDFIEDPETGIQDEIDFWNKITTHKNKLA